MPPDGFETLARWREAGEWWKGEPPKEVHRYIDANGVRREDIEIARLTDAREKSRVQVKRFRDEKVTLATGNFTPHCYGNLNRHSVSGVLLHALSGYAFCRGTMGASSIPAMARELGYGAALIADPFSLTGVKDFQSTANHVDIQPLIGATLEMADGGELVLVAKNATGYRSLSRLITDCHLEEPRLYPLCNWERLARHSEGLICLTGGSNGVIDRLLIRRDYKVADKILKLLIRLYGRDDVFIQVERSYLPWQISVEKSLAELAQLTRVAQVAGGPVLHERRGDFPAHDVLVCADSLCLIDEIEGRKPPRDPSQPASTTIPRRSLNAERYLKTVDESMVLYADRPELLANSWRVAERCEANVLPGPTNLPGRSDDDDLRLSVLAFSGSNRLYRHLSRNKRDEVMARIKAELGRIAKFRWSRYFLIAHDMCQWAEDQGILLSGRGSVVDSVVAYCLGLSRVDAFTFELHFDRFLPPHGRRRPDIDIDFEAARREDVRQYLVSKYGDAHVATVAAIGTFGTRGIVREVGKVMGIPDESISYLTKRLHGSVSAAKLESAIDARPELRDSGIPRERFHWVFKLAEILVDLPRGLRAHSSGVVLSETPIADTVPVVQSGADGVKIIQWDKRSAKYCFDKYDILCLRGNDVLGGTARNVGSDLDVKNLPLDDPEVFRAFRAGNLIGIPQSASPAMRQAHIRIGTSDLKDAGIVQAGIRPGVGGAVKLNEYIARRKGKPFELVHPDMARILEPTLGIVVFQEQIDQLLGTFAGYGDDDFENIRETIQAHHSRGNEAEACPQVRDRILANGYSQLVANEVYDLIAGFKGYGFAEGHALAFAEVSIRSVWCQQNYPAQYFAALLDAQPAGYYGPATIANEARNQGAKVLPPDVNHSEDAFSVQDFKAEDDPKLVVPKGGIRVPLKQISGLSNPTRERALLHRPFDSFFDFVTRVNPARDELETMILCGAFDEFHPNRRALLWTIPSAIDHGATLRGMTNALPIFMEDPPIPTGIEDFSPGEKAIAERSILGLDVKQHLMAFERARILSKGGLTSAEASKLPGGTHAFVVGNPIRLRFPPTQSGRRVMFFDLEDETGLLNVTCFDDIYQRDGHKVICNPYITLFGEAQDRDGHIAFMASRIHAYQPTMEGVSTAKVMPIATADFLMT